MAAGQSVVRKHGLRPRLNASPVCDAQRRWGGFQSTRTQYQLVPSQLVSKLTRTRYQLVTKLSRTYYQLVPIQLIPKSTRTQRDSKEINKPKNVNHSKNQIGAIT